MRRSCVLSASCVLVLLILPGIRGSAQSGVGGPAPPPEPYSPKIAPASDEAEQAIKGFRVTPGFNVEVFAAEPLLANPVAFCVDERNRFYIAETFRYHAGVTDTRSHMYWLNDDLASRTIEDRLAMYKKHLGAKVASYGIEHDRVQRVEDRDGDGKADHATVLADGFNEILGGIGAGVVARGSDVWFSCIPSLWRLSDLDDDGRADRRELLHRGYGVHVGFLGHDLHGLRFGPDGRLYFSIGDRGFNVQTREGRNLVEIASGTVLRCDPDGTNLEIFASGLRNPQELAFDEHGNMFTCDNNSDSGDKARWVYVVEGGDSGWRIGYQFLQQPVSRGPWNAEKLWDPIEAKRAAYLVPPLANISDGPSGLTYDPGTGLPERYRHHFFLCDYRGMAGQSGIRTFANKPSGASFELVDSRQLIWGVLSTDVDFGTDSALYITDWIERIARPGEPRKGRIYRITNPGLANDPQALQVKTLLAEGMNGRSLDALASFLAHGDYRVRQAAQFALAGRGIEAVATLARVAADEHQQLARLHAIWGLGQIGRTQSEAYEPLVALLDSRDAEVRAQSARLLGEGKIPSVSDRLIALLSDESPRVRFFASIALGKLGKLRRGRADPCHAAREQRSRRLPATRRCDGPGGDWQSRRVARRVGRRLAGRAAGGLAGPAPAGSSRGGAVPRRPRAGAGARGGACDQRRADRVGHAGAGLVGEPTRVVGGADRVGAPPRDQRQLPTGRSGVGRGPGRTGIAIGNPRRDPGRRPRRAGRLGPTVGRDRVMGLWRPLEPRPAAQAADGGSGPSWRTC